MAAEGLREWSVDVFFLVLFLPIPSIPFNWPFDGREAKLKGLGPYLSLCLRLSVCLSVCLSHYVRQISLGAIDSAFLVQRVWP